MNKKVPFLILFYLFFGCGEERVTENENRLTFYVSPIGNDFNNGTISAPWKTIQASIDKLKKNSTLIVKRGVYHEKVILFGDKNSNLTIQGERGAILDGNNIDVVEREGLISIHNAHHITINNLELRNFKTKKGHRMVETPIGLFIHGSSHDINITNNKIHHIENLSTCGESTGCGTGANGIAVYGDTRVTMKNLNFIGNEIYNCILSSSEAFTINGNISGFKVLENYVHDNNNIGIDIIGYEEDVCMNCLEEENRARNGIVRYNRSINNSTNTKLRGFLYNPWYEGNEGSAGGFYVDGGHHIIFEGNHASQNDLGFEFASEHSNKSTNDILMVNNYIYNNREAGLSLGGYGLNSDEEGGGNASNILIYNNSFYKNSGWGSEISFAYRVYDVRLVNNIIYGKDDVTLSISEEDGDYKNLFWGVNLWWRDDGIDSATLYGELILSNPLYVNTTAGNLDLSFSSSAKDRGRKQEDIYFGTDAFWKKEFINGIVPSHGISDINGNKRFHNEVDLGANEF